MTKGEKMTGAKGISPWRSNKDAVSTSSNPMGRAPIRIFRSKNDEVEKTCEVKCPVNLYFMKS